MEQNGNFLAEKNIGEATRLAILDVLTRQYLGQGGLLKLIDEVPGITRTTYYRMRDHYPDDFDEIKREAHTTAIAERSDNRTSHDAFKEDLTYDTERYVGDHVREVVDALLLVVRGQPYEVDVLVNRKDEDGEWEKVYEPKSIVPYPRDMVSAANMLHTFLRDGVIPDSAPMLQRSAVEEDVGRGGLMPIFGANTAFKRIEGVAPDGTKVVVEVDHPDIIDITEIDDEDGAM